MLKTKKRLLLLAVAATSFITFSSFTLLAAVPFWGTTTSCSEAGQYLNPALALRMTGARGVMIRLIVERLG